MTHDIVILTGAGISAESGIQTFRSTDGAPALWAEHDVDDVATVAGYERDPALVHQFYNARRADINRATPNAAHIALGRLSVELGDKVLVITQNIDDLHERGGLPANQLIHMHGRAHSSFCPACGERVEQRSDLAPSTLCAVCRIGYLRPDIVWFGERPYQMGRIEQAVQDALLFVAIGTSGEVYPAAGLRHIAASCGVPTVEMNLHPTRTGFDIVTEGPATHTVPAFVDDVLSGFAPQ